MSSIFCAIQSCKKVKVIGRFCLRHYGDKFWLKLRCCLEDIYSPSNLESQLQQMLPDPITLKDFSTFLSFLRIGFNHQDLKVIFQVFSGKNNCIVARNTLISFLLMPETNWDVEDEPIFIPKAPVEPVRPSRTADFREMSPFSSYKFNLSLKLQEAFPDFQTAWNKFSKGKSIGFFEFTRMLNYLSIPCGEKTVKTFLMKTCKSSSLNEQNFKSIWFNRRTLCKKSQCGFEANHLGFCKSHERLLCRKGSVYLTEIESGLDKRKVFEMREKLENLGNISLKMTKNLFGPFCNLTEQDWEAVWVYVNLQIISSIKVQNSFLRPTKSMVSFESVVSR